MPENKRHDVFISYSSRDRSIVKQVIEDLKIAGLKLYDAEVDLPPGEYINEGILDGLGASKGVVIFISPAAAESGWVYHEIQTAQDMYANKELKFIIFVMLRAVEDERLTRMIRGRKMLDFSGKYLHEGILGDLSKQLIEAIHSHLPVAGENVVEMPFVIIAMKEHEARGLLVDKSVTPVNPDTFAKIMKELADKSFTPEHLVNFYGEARDDWRSPLCQADAPGRCGPAPEQGGDGAPAGQGGQVTRCELVTIKEFIENVVQRINDSPHDMDENYIINPLFKSEAFTDSDQNVRIKAHTELEDRCVLVVDTLSLFHPLLALRLDKSPLAHRTKNVIPIAVPPPYRHPPESVDELIESAMKDMMTLPFDRFENGDALCEFGINHPRALKRWLFAALPKAARKFSRPLPREDNRDNFRRGNFY